MHSYLSNGTSVSSNRVNVYATFIQTHEIMVCTFKFLVTDFVRITKKRGRQPPFFIPQNLRLIPLMIKKQAI